ncbi:MAG: hypothetical protein H7839_19165, partial [Magnetococcus sp. YQC-5]
KETSIDFESATWLMILAGYKLRSQKSSINNCSARYFSVFYQALCTEKSLLYLCGSLIMLER